MLDFVDVGITGGGLWPRRKAARLHAWRLPQRTAGWATVGAAPNQACKEGTAKKMRERQRKRLTEAAHAGEFLLPWLERASGCLQLAGQTNNADLWPSNAEAASASAKLYCSSLDIQLRYCRTQPGAHAWPPCRTAPAALLRVECSKNAAQVGQEVVSCGLRPAACGSGGQGCSFWGEAQAEASSSVLPTP